MSEINKPENGWLVVCMALGQYQIALNEDGLASIVDKLWHKCDKEIPEHYANNLIQVFELGKQVSVRIKPTITSIAPITKEK